MSRDRAKCASECPATVPASTIWKVSSRVGWDPVVVARWSEPAREALKAGAYPKQTPAVGPPTVKRPFLASADPEV